MSAAGMQPLPIDDSLPAIVAALRAKPALVLVAEPHADAEGLPAKSLLQQEMLKRGVLYNGSHFVCWAHTEADVDETLAAYDGAFAVLASALPDHAAQALEGPALGPVFRAVA